MEYWIFQPEENITALELANMLGKFKKLNVYMLVEDGLRNLLCVDDRTYDGMLPECRRHFTLYKDGRAYREYTVGD